MIGYTVGLHLHKPSIEFITRLQGNHRIPQISFGPNFERVVTAIAICIVR